MTAEDCTGEWYYGSRTPPGSSPHESHYQRSARLAKALDKVWCSATEDSWKFHPEKLWQAQPRNAQRSLRRSEISGCNKPRNGAIFRPSWNQRWQWKILYIWRFIAGKIHENPLYMEEIALPRLVHSQGPGIHPVPKGRHCPTSAMQTVDPKDYRPGKKSTECHPMFKLYCIRLYLLTLSRKQNTSNGLPECCWVASARRQHTWSV